MAYTINKTDGSVLTTVPDGQIDDFSSSITLIGKNFSGFGEFINENFIGLLENFSNSASPSNPVRGQIWFDTKDLKLKVYNGTGFVPVGSATVSNTQPIDLAAGDLWFNDIDKQLYVFDGISLLLLGPIFSTSQGLSGFRVVSILDTDNRTRVVTNLYTNGTLLGIFSKDEFTPKNLIDGFTGTIFPGFNAGNLPEFKFDVTSSNAEKLGNVPASNYVRNDQSNVIEGQLRIESNLGLIVGDNQQAQLQIQGGNVTFSNIEPNKNTLINVLRGTNTETAIELESVTRTVNFYPSADSAVTPQVNINGNLSVTGDLVVEGVTSFVNTSNLAIENKIIELALTEEPDDIFATGGGLTLKGTTDHYFTWTKESRAWNSSEHINLVTSESVPNPEYKINGVTVLSATSLGPSITSIPGVTNFGVQRFVEIGAGDPIVAEMRLENNKIKLLSDNDLEIDVSSGNISLIGNPRITGVSPPIDLNDAVNKDYVDTQVKSKNIVLSLDISDGISDMEIASLIEQIAPISEHHEGTVARILCSHISISTTTVDVNPLINVETDLFNQPTGLKEAIVGIDVNPLTSVTPEITVTRSVKTFQISGGAWTFVS